MARFGSRRDVLLVLFFVLLIGFLSFFPTGFESKVPTNSIRCRGEILAADNSEVRQYGIIRLGTQVLTVFLKSGPFKGKRIEATNELIGKLELDKFFSPGDIALIVLSLKDEKICYANAQDHYRIGIEIILLAAFAVLLILFGGWTGTKALLSFVFAVLVVWKILIPSFLKGYDPVIISTGVVMVLTAAIIFLVGGLSRRGLVAFIGSALGIVMTCLLALLFSRGFHLHGAVKPFSETLLYCGFPDLDLSRIFIASVFMASSGAVMDLAMDVASSLDEVVKKKPDIRFCEALNSGFSVGRAVVGTMTTTLLLAYSSSYVTLLMVFMAQGIPLTNILNMTYVAAEILNTVVGSFGLVTVAPFTALTGSLLYTKTGSVPESKG
jgi:uncharacterized membrane protein